MPLFLALNVSNDVLLTVALVLFILVCIVWLVDRFRR